MTQESNSSHLLLVGEEVEFWRAISQVSTYTENMGTFLIQKSSLSVFTLRKFYICKLWKIYKSFHCIIIYKNEKLVHLFLSSIIQL